MVRPKVLSLHYTLRESKAMKKSLLIAAIFLFLLPASLASAHDPIILTSDQRTPTSGPLLVDGTISFAIYGSLDTEGDTRGFRVKFREGDPLYISILIPDLSPENMLNEDLLPVLNVESPDGVTVKLAVTEKVSFPEPFTGTNYVRLTELRGVAVSGIYSITVTGDSSARFTVSVGEKEMFGSTVENIPNRNLGIAGVMTWYAGEPNTATLSNKTTFNNQIILVTGTVVVAAVVLGFARVRTTRRRKNKSFD